MSLKWLSYSAIQPEQKSHGQKWATFISGEKYNLLSVSAIPISSFQQLKKVLSMNFSITIEFKSYLFHAVNVNVELYQFFAAVFNLWIKSSILLLFSDLAKNMTLTKSQLKKSQPPIKKTKTQTHKQNKKNPIFYLVFWGLDIHCSSLLLENIYPFFLLP